MPHNMQHHGKPISLRQMELVFQYPALAVEVFVIAVKSDLAERPDLAGSTQSLEIIQRKIADRKIGVNARAEQDSGVIQVLIEVKLRTAQS